MQAFRKNHKIVFTGTPGMPAGMTPGMPGVAAGMPGVAAGMPGVAAGMPGVAGLAESCVFGSVRGI